MTTQAGTAGALASTLCLWLDRLFPDADRGERLERALDERFGDDARAVTEELCHEVEGVAHDSCPSTTPRPASSPRCSAGRGSPGSPDP